MVLHFSYPSAIHIYVLVGLKVMLLISGLSVCQSE